MSINWQDFVLDMPLIVRARRLSDRDLVGQQDTIRTFLSRNRRGPSWILLLD